MHLPCCAQCRSPPPLPCTLPAAVKEGLPRTGRPASPSGNPPGAGGSSGGGGSEPPGDGDRGRGGAGGGDSWGASALAFAAKHPNGALTSVCAISTGAYLFLYHKIDEVAKEVKEVAKASREHNQKMFDEFLTGLAQHGVAIS